MSPTHLYSDWTQSLIHHSLQIIKQPVLFLQRKWWFEDIGATPGWGRCPAALGAQNRTSQRPETESSAGSCSVICSSVIRICFLVSSYGQWQASQGLALGKFDLRPCAVSHLSLHITFPLCHSWPLTHSLPCILLILVTTVFSLVTSRFPGGSLLLYSQTLSTSLFFSSMYFIFFRFPYILLSISV